MPRIDDAPQQPSNNAGKSAAGRFQPGNRHGRGRPSGSRNNASLVLDKMLADDGADVVRAILAAAKGGDMQAARLVLDRIVPVRKGRSIQLDLPAIENVADVLAALSATIAAMAEGDITPDEAAIAAGVLETKRKAIETVELVARLARLEQQTETKR
jgi:hypothetical protein